MNLMAKMTIRFLLAALFVAVSAQAASPPAGNQFPVQSVKTGSYTIKQSDLKTAIPMNCSTACTVMFPQATSSWPKGYPVLIQSIGSANVTISATVSILYGMPLTAGSIVLTTPGFAYVNADPANNYFAWGVEGATAGITQLTGAVVAGPGTGSQAAMITPTGVTAGSYTNPNITVNPAGQITVASNGSGGGGVTSLSQGPGILLTPNPTVSTGTVATNGLSTNITVASACEGMGCTPVTQCFAYTAGVLEGITTGACSGGSGASLTGGGGGLTGGGGTLTGG